MALFCNLPFHANLYVRACMFYGLNDACTDVCQSGERLVEAHQRRAEA